MCVRFPELMAQFFHKYIFPGKHNTRYLQQGCKKQQQQQQQQHQQHQQQGKP